MVQFEKARIEDTKALALVSWHAFDYDVHYGAPGPGGPKGYKSDIWQAVLMGKGSYIKILLEHRIIGGFLVVKPGPATFELERIFIDPKLQNQGIGSQTLLYVETVFSEAERWRVKTHRWNRRNQHFLEKMGYSQAGLIEPDGLLYEKHIKRAVLYN